MLFSPPPSRHESYGFSIFYECNSVPFFFVINLCVNDNNAQFSKCHITFFERKESNGHDSIQPRFDEKKTNSASQNLSGTAACYEVKGQRQNRTIVVKVKNKSYAIP